MNDKVKSFLKNIPGRIKLTPGKRISVTASAIMLVLLIILAMTIVNPGAFWKISNIGIIIDRTVILLMFGAGLTFVLLSSSVNLAVGGMLSLSSILVATLSAGFGFWTIPAVLIAGFIQGSAIGLVFTRFRIPSFIATYGMMGVFSSLAILVSPTSSAVIIDRSLMQILSVLQRVIIPGTGIKTMWIFAIVIFAIFLFVDKRTAFGKHVAALGNSPEAVRYSGLSIDRIKTICYGLSGVSVGIGAIFLCSSQYTGDPTVGGPYTLMIVATVIVGGTSLTGGSGGVFNTLLGALTIAVSENAMIILGINVFYHQILIGFIMILAVAMSLDKERLLVVK